MTSITPFQYGVQQVRTLTVDGEPWFVAADVARVLGYRMASDMTRRLDDDEKGTQKTRTPSGDQDMTVINEPGLYSAILRSTIASARDFKRWVTHEVLPEIRRTGQFGSQLPTTFAQALELAAAQAKAIEASEAALAAAAPKVEAFDSLMDADGYYDMGAAAKIVGLGRNTMMRQLREQRILMADNLPYQQYTHHFKVTSGTRTDHLGNTIRTFTTRVRPSGLQFIRKRLGLIPSELV